MAFSFNYDWFSQNIPQWEIHLRELRGEPVHVLEIGSWEGRSSCWLLKNILTHPDATLTCVDLFEADTEEHQALSGRHPGIVATTLGIEDIFDKNIAEINPGTKLVKRKESSRTVIRGLPLAHFDVIEIDGSHTASNVLLDAVLCWDVLKPGGIMIFDDYCWACFPENPLKTPRPAINAFLKIFKGQYTLLHKEYQVIIQKHNDESIPNPTLPAVFMNHVSWFFAQVFLRLQRISRHNN